MAVVATPDGQARADHYVVAGGAWSGKLLGEEALGLDIRPVRGQILLFKAAPGLLPHIVYRQGRYLVPRLDGHVLAGSTLAFLNVYAARLGASSFQIGLLNIMSVDTYKRK